MSDSQNPKEPFIWDSLHHGMTIEMTGGDEPDPEPLPDLPHMDFWVHLYPDGHSLEAEILDFVTEEASWWEWAGQDGWEYALLPWRKTEKLGHLEFDIANQDWAKAEGIAPEQRFLVRMERPSWHTDYYGETDCDFEIYVVEKEPLSEEEAEARWSTYFLEQKTYWEASLKKSLEDREKQLTDFGAMYLQSSVYYNHRYWDDMACPNGYRLYLITKNSAQGFSGQLASGESNNGDRAEAMDKLVSDALTNIPGITEDAIRKLPTRSYW